MRIKAMNALKSIGILSLVSLLIVSCSDDDLNSIDAGVIDNLNFVTKELISEVEFSNEPITTVESSINGQFLLGVYDEDEISRIRGSFVSQLVLPSDITYYDETIYPDTIVTSTIDDVVLYIPYHSTVTDIENDTIYTYQLDSIFGVKSIDSDDVVTYGAFDFSVFELATFLNPLDPTDPSKTNVYYSDKEYDVNNTLAEVLDFRPSATQVITEIERPQEEGDPVIEFVELTNGAPRIAVHLDKDFFQTQILDKLPAEGEDIPSDFQSQESFVRYFKGLYVNATSTDAASIATLPLTNAFVSMYYTNVLTSVSQGTEIDRIAETMTFPLGGVKAVKYESTVAAAQDPKKLYIQGTVGSQANIKLFGYDENNPTVVSEELNSLRAQANDENDNALWLLNEANLLFYVDDDFVATEDVYKLFLYKKVPDIDGVPGYNSQLLDYITAPSLTETDGSLVEVADGPNYYKFKITDYVTDLLMGKDEGGNLNVKNVDNLGLKIYNEGDYPVSTSDTIISTNSWNPKGVVLFGGASDDVASENRLKLIINYSYQIR